MWCLRSRANHMNNDEFRAILSRAVALEDEPLSFEEIKRRVRRIGEELRLKLAEPHRPDLVPATRLRVRDGRLSLEAGFEASPQPILPFDPRSEGNLDQALDEAARGAPDAIVDRHSRILRGVAGDQNAKLTPRDRHYIDRFGGGQVELPLVNEKQHHLLPDRPSPCRGGEECCQGAPSQVTRSGIKLRRLMWMPRAGGGVPFTEFRRDGIMLTLKGVPEPLQCEARCAAVEAMNAGRGFSMRFMAVPYRDPLTGELARLEFRSLLE